MKKILSLGAAAAVLSLTAAVASAAIAPTFTPDAPVAGDTLTVQIVANGMTQEATTFTVQASDNLTLTGSTKTESGLAEFNTETNKFAWAGSSVPADGTVLLTLTYTVDAAADEEVSVTLVPDAGFTDISADAVAAVVVANGDDVNDTTVETVDTADTFETVEPGITDDTADTADTADTSDANNGDNKGDNKGNPDTGVALAVVPAVLAGAAIVVAKKRK